MGPKAKISKLSNDSLGTLTTRIIHNIDASTVTEVKTSDYYALCVEVMGNYKTATTKKEKKKDDAINVDFRNRKDIFGEIRKYLQGLQISPDEEIKAAANRAYTELNRFGRDFVNSKTADQSYIYGQIIAGLKKPELSADMLALKLNAKVDQLEAAHSGYEEQYMQWGNFKKAALTASTLRNEVETALKNLLDELDWLLRKTPTEAVKNLHTSVYARIDEINLSKSKDKPDETSDTIAGGDTAA
jgi:hypothetical protein